MRKIFLLLLSVACLSRALLADDWPEWRGPARSGTSAEKGLPTQWSPSGRNLAWKAPYGGRSTPVVLGNHLYLQNTAGKGATEQERVLCLDTRTGKLLWEYRFNVYHSDVPVHRVGWASPAVDPATGNVFVFGVNGTLLALSPQGKLLWERSMVEDFGIITTHGGRTVSPIVDGDLLHVSAVTFGWGAQAGGAHRYFAFDKKTGQTIWVSAPEGRPTDTVYPAGIIAAVNGTRQLIEGGSDGAIHALKPQTGEPVWKFEMSKRGINNGVLLKGTTAIVSHSEENLDTSEMGMIAAIDVSGTGPRSKEHVRWRVNGFLGGFPSPVLDGDRIYQVDNGATLLAFDFNTGRELWRKSLGTVQKASPVLADGKLYVGTESGKFYILKPGPGGCEILSQVVLGKPDAPPEQVLASVAVAHGRVYMLSTEALYAIGSKSPTPNRTSAASPADESGSGPPAAMLVTPTELVLKPGESARFHARLYDAQGRFLREDKADWSLEQLQGKIGQDGQFTAAGPGPQAGLVKAAVGSLSAAARLRVIPPLPYSENFDSLAPGPRMPSFWINATNKYEIRELEGNKVLAKLNVQRPFHYRARTFIGASDWSNYTVQADVRSATRRRQMGDIGVTAQRYELVLFGNHQRMELQSWQPEEEHKIKAAFEWKPDTWYRIKLEVQNLPDGRTRARGKIWPAAESEPSAWAAERIDPQPNRQGSPGIYGDAGQAEVFFDNLKVTPNR